MFSYFAVFDEFLPDLLRLDNRMEGTTVYRVLLKMLYIGFGQ